MPRGVPLSDEERQRIIDLLGTGRSCRSIAREVGHSTSTVSKIAKSVGHVFGRTNLARAREAQQAYGAEWRAQFAKRMSAEAERLLEKLHDPHLVFNFGGRDNTYEEHTLPEPPVDAKERLVKSTSILVQRVLDIDRHDRSDDAMAVVDDWLKELKGDS